MKLRNHRLVRDEGSNVPFEKTPNQSGELAGGQPKYIVMHFTANGSARGAISWLSNPQAKASAHLVIAPDGSITQMVKLNEKAWHAGRSSWKGLNGMNSHSVGIEMVNWGGLKGSRGSWKSWTGTPVADDRVIEAAHKHSPGNVCGWELYDEPQIDAAIASVAAIAAEYGIGPQEVIGHEDISPGRKTDPGPSWDMERFRARVFGREEETSNVDLFEVAASSGLNMRSGPGVDGSVVELLQKGTKVMPVERQGLWWLVSKMEGDEPDTTGWVHSNWLTQV